MKRARKKNIKRKLLWSKDEEKERRETRWRFITIWKKMFLFVPFRVFSVEKNTLFMRRACAPLHGSSIEADLQKEPNFLLRGIFNCVTSYIFDMVASQRVCTPENGSSMPFMLIVFLSHQNPCFETEKHISFAIVPLSSEILHQLPTRDTWGDPFIRLWAYGAIITGYALVKIPPDGHCWRANPIYAIRLIRRAMRYINVFKRGGR